VLGPNHNESLWSELRFVVGLDDSMGLMIKAEMRWMNRDLHAKIQEYRIFCRLSILMR